MMRALWGEFRSGAPLAAGILSLVVGVMLGASVGSQPMLPGCADPLNVGLILGVTISPIALGSAAVHVAMLERGGLLHLAGTSGRGRSGALRLAWLAVAIWQTLAYSGAQLFILWNADTAGHCSISMLVLPAAGITFSLLMSGVGILLGAAIPHWATGVMGAAVGFFAVLGLQRLDGDFSRFVPTFIFTYYQPFYEPNVGLNLAHMALYISLALLIWALLLQRRRYRAVGASVAACAVVASIGLALAVNADPVQYRVPEERECASSAEVEFCVWPESAAALTAGLDAILRTREIVGDRIPTPSLYLQEGLTEEGAGLMMFDSKNISEGELQSAADRAMISQPVCEEGLDGWFAILDWITAASQPDYAPAEILAVRDLSDEQQRAWLTEHYQVAVSACD